MTLQPHTVTRQGIALLGPMLLALGLGACSVKSAQLPETHTPPPGGYGGYAGGHATVQPTRAVVSAPTVHYTQGYPPAPLHETVPTSSYGDQVWIDGSWHWNGYEWMWIDGRWVEDDPELVYIQPYYDYYDTGHVYQPGYWSPRAQVPATVVVSPRQRYRGGYYDPGHGHASKPRIGGGPKRPVTGYHPKRPSRRVPGAGHARSPVVRDHRHGDRRQPGARVPSRPGNQAPDRAGRPPVTRRPPPVVSSPRGRGAAAGNAALRRRPPRMIPGGSPQARGGGAKSPARPAPSVGLPPARVGATGPRPRVGGSAGARIPPRPTAPPPGAGMGGPVGGPIGGGVKAGPRPRSGGVRHGGGAKHSAGAVGGGAKHRSGGVRHGGGVKRSSGAIGGGVKRGPR